MVLVGVVSYPCAFWMGEDELHGEFQKVILNMDIRSPRCPFNHEINEGRDSLFCRYVKLDIHNLHAEKMIVFHMHLIILSPRP